MRGNVYFIRCQEFVKVGYALDVQERLSILQTGCPHELQIIAILPGVAPSLERIFHVVLAGKRHRGEWFALDDELRTMIDMMQRRLNSPRVFRLATESDVRRLLDPRNAKKRQRQKAASMQGDRAELFARLRLASTGSDA